MPRLEVLWFADRMENELRANDHKDGWGDLSERWLLNRLRQETKELQRVLGEGVPADRIISEAADVANFAMMIADNARDRAAAVKEKP
jgi:NTP pyrophosphatase (non-canonical NTP hydrolase)